MISGPSDGLLPSELSKSFSDPLFIVFSHPLLRVLSVSHLTPKSDWNSTSPYNITSESNIKVTRINELISN